MSLYNTLQIPVNSSLEDIKKAYYKLSLIYHPDKNKHPEAKDKFYEIKCAYDILSNEKSRKEYSKLNHTQENNFWLLLQGWIKKYEIDELLLLLQDNNYKQLKKVINNIQNLSLIQILSWIHNPSKPIDIIKNISLDSDDNWNIDNPLYLDELPLKYIQQQNTLDIYMNVSIDINDIIDNKNKKIKIIRNINNKKITNSFTFNISKPYVIFPNAGDTLNLNKGDLVFILNIQNNWNWSYDGIYLDKKITLFQWLYGINFNIKLSKYNFTIRDWIPHRDGNKLFIDKKLPIDLYIKLILDLPSSNKHKYILQTHFN